jgi:hypothetical protein
MPARIVPNQGLRSVRVTALQAVAVIFDFVKPLGGGRDVLPRGRQAKLEFDHDRNIEIDVQNCESSKSFARTRRLSLAAGVALPFELSGSLGFLQFRVAKAVFP